MLPAPLPANETERLRALRELAVLDTAAEERFDRLTRLVGDVFRMPISLVTLVDADRQWFKSRQGLDVAETPRDVSFCGHAIVGDDIFVVSDAQADSRFADNPLVTEDPAIRFYAGAPLRTSDGQAVGTLCVIDRDPHDWTPEQSRILRDLADLVEIELNQLRLQNQQQALLALTAVTALSNEDRRELMRSALRLGCDYLGMDTGVISRVDGQDYDVFVASSPGGVVTEGEHYALGDTYCELAMAADTVVAIATAAGAGHDAHPCHVRYGIEAYIGVAVRVDESPFGTLAFFSRDPRAQADFTDADRDFVRLLGRWVSAVLQRWHVDDELDQQQRISRFITRAQSTFILSEMRSMAFEGLLEDILELTACEYGFIGEVLHDDEGAPYLKTRALTNIAWNEATRRLYDENYANGLEFRNLDTLFGVTLRTGEPVIANDPYGDSRRGGLPSEHPPMDSYIGLPVLRAGEMIGMLGLANMPGGFPPQTVEYLEPLLVTIGQLIEASVIQRLRQGDQRQISRLSLVASQTTNGVLITDHDGVIEWVNDGFNRMFGYRSDELIGQRPRAILHGPGTNVATEAMIREAMRLREPFAAELLAYDRDGEALWVDLESNPLSSADGTPEGFMVMVSDISERKRVERMKTQFVSTVSHELRTPLTAISGALGLVAGGVTGELPEQAQGLVAIAQKNSQRLTALIDDLLDMEKLVEGGIPMELEVQEVMPVIERAISDNQTYAAKYGVGLALVERADGVLADVDSLRLVQVMANLLSNSCKFAPQDSTVDVAVTRFHGQVRVSVSDTGPGIPESFRDVIFEKFSQADASDTRSSGGTGLGLAISKELVERMGGSIGYESFEGKGATFFVDLPIAEAPNGG